MELPTFLWECAMKFEQSREAWNKGKLVGQKPPLKFAMSPTSIRSCRGHRS
ncbi:hypothetical protein R69927_02499 [Paraburkholderia domus]|jgi:hypothetical protein|uniref:Uncharacterized protein n=1 Tax=Paraburkholderia domus TaxID=2793075 RepID=A0A9N8QZN2_9BURK|nr:hypothetical protein R75483_02136 [Paraburkholderia domus]CAE6779549.1 hypothetical protein R70006_04330 [Paraburkholderia domus]CAE6803637.1 hypothetical protein R69749_02728 [Paraburkholderia domus]CAE6858855.1 hypothetical protein R69927_02499 [Paraburkholderia domus]CAE6889930.1 hypothetical protein R70199_03055 [Paraburkholderia domus]